MSKYSIASFVESVRGQYFTSDAELDASDTYSYPESICLTGVALSVLGVNSVWTYLVFGMSVLSTSLVMTIGFYVSGVLLLTGCVGWVVTWYGSSMKYYLTDDEFVCLYYAGFTSESVRLDDVIRCEVVYSWHERLVNMVLDRDTGSLRLTTNSGSQLVTKSIDDVETVHQTLLENTGS